jgi:hypothetical protein
VEWVALFHGVIGWCRKIGFHCFEAIKEGDGLVADCPEAPIRLGAADRAPVGRASLEVFEFGLERLTVFRAAPLLLLAVRKLVYIRMKSCSGS